MTPQDELQCPKYKRSIKLSNAQLKMNLGAKIVKSIYWWYFLFFHNVYHEIELPIESFFFYLLLLKSIIKKKKNNCYTCTNFIAIISEDKFIVSKRGRYLHQLQQYRNEGRPIFFMDETYCKYASKVWKFKNFSTHIFCEIDHRKSRCLLRANSDLHEFLI